MRCTYLRFNLGPLHHSDGLVNEIVASDTNKNDQKRLVTSPKMLTIVLVLLVLKRKSSLPSHFEVPLPSHPNESVMLRL